MQITWDRFAVPTITGEDDLDVVRGIGYAQAVAIGNEVLEMYGIARGRAAEYWGAAFLVEDTFTAHLGLQAKTDEWLANQLPETLERIEAFCQGFNEACDADEARGGERRAVLPVVPRDVIAHMLRLFVRFNQIDGEQLAFSPMDFFGMEKPGSSSWAVGGKKSTTGNAMVLINPHMSWKLKYHRFVEFRTVSPGRDFHGCTLAGFAWQSMGYSPDVAWAHTVNPIRNLVVYTADIRDDGTYLFDGQRRPLTTIDHTILVKDADPVVVTERRTVHGPVVTAPDGTDVAIRMASVLDEPAYTAAEGWWQLTKAKSVEELFAVHDRLPLPMFTITAGDADGKVGALYCGKPPVRESWDETKRRIDGTDPATAVFRVHPASSTPRVLDPECGWVQNCNETPYTFTSPVLDESSYPPAVAPPATEMGDLRAAVSRDWLTRHETVSPEQFRELKWLKRAVFADLCLDELLAEADKHEDLAKPVEVLRAWDREMGATSKGYVLCLLTLALSAPSLMASGTFYAPHPAGALPERLNDPAAVVEFLRAAAGLMGLVGVPLDAALGDLVTIGPEALPGNGSSGILGGTKCLEAMPTASGGLEVVVGDTWVSHVELRKGQAPVADSILVYGNTTDPAAPPAEDQYALWNADQLRPREVTA